MQTELKYIIQIDLLESDIYQTVYYAFDKLKNKNCLITIANRPTSWSYILDYNL